MFFITSCEKDPISDQTTPDDSSTLDKDLSGSTGFIDDYFYDLE